MSKLGNNKCQVKTFLKCNHFFTKKSKLDIAFLYRNIDCILAFIWQHVALIQKMLTSMFVC